LGLRRLEEIDSVELQAFGIDDAVLGGEAHDGAAGLRLAGAAFPDDAQPLAAEREGDAAHGLDEAGARREGDTQVLDGQKSAHWPLPRGSSASRRPSPSRLKPRLTTRMAKPGIAATHHWSRMKRRPDAIMAPHSGSGGCAPSPRKPSPAAGRVMPAMSSGTRTSSDE